MMNKDQKRGKEKTNRKEKLLKIIAGLALIIIVASIVCMYGLFIINGTV